MPYPDDMDWAAWDRHYGPDPADDAEACISGTTDEFAALYVLAQAMGFEDILQPALDHMLNDDLCGIDEAVAAAARERFWNGLPDVAAALRAVTTAVKDVQ